VNFATRAVIPALWASIALAGCDSTSPNEEVAGSYAATTFLYIPTGQQPQDVLAAGGSLAIGLTGDGTTTGTLFVPATITGTGDLIESMAGTFTRTGATLTFDQEADTFVRDVTWTVSRNTLTGTYSDADASIEVTLSIE